MIEDTLDWIWWAKPEINGWYAISYSWDAEEGIFVGADYWDGMRWTEQLPVACFAGPFENEGFASEWAYAHDIGA